MHTLLSLALMLPALLLTAPAMAAPTAAEWSQQEGERTRIVFVDGTEVTGVLVDLRDNQARIRGDDGSITFVPMGVVESIAPAPSAAAAPRPTAPPPPDDAQSGQRPRPSPSIGLGIGVGSGPVSVGVGGVTGSRPATTGPSAGSFGQGREWVLVGVRYPLRGRETIDWMLFDRDGSARELPPDLLRPRALKDYTFIDQWGRSVPWQAAWAAMDAERDYIVQVKKMDNILIPLRATETVLWASGLGLIVYSVVDSMTAQRLQNNTLWYVGGGLIVGNIVFNVAVTTPTRNRLRIELGRKGVQRAQEHFGLNQ